jgi:hypothetical protein
MTKALINGAGNYAKQIFWLLPKTSFNVHFSRARLEPMTGPQETVHPFA